MKQILILSVIAALPACTTTKSTMNAIGDNKVVEGVTTAPEAKDVNSISDDPTFGEALLSPLSDINVRKVEIPELLLTMDDPYAPIPEKSCRSVYNDIIELNTVLGSDMDAPDYEAKTEKRNRKRKETSLDFVGAAASSFIPFRGLVRTATGATAYEKELRAQYRKGVARRAYLRGIYDAKDCQQTAGF